MSDYLRQQIALMRAHRKTLAALLERDKRRLPELRPVAWLTSDERAAIAHAVTSYQEGADMLEDELAERLTDEPSSEKPS
jgi:hypothetical protein